MGLTVDRWARELRTGAILRELRLLRRLERYTIAQRSGLDQGVITAIEEEQYEPSPDEQAIILATLLGCAPKQLQALMPLLGDNLLPLIAELLIGREVIHRILGQEEIVSWKLSS